MFLLDVNVLVALGWQSHSHHRRAEDWFAAHRDRGWATTPTTQCGFVRLSCNPQVASVVVRPPVAIAVLRRLVGGPGHTFFPDRLEPLDVLDIGLRGYRQITDAYLVVIARHNGARLATFDAAMVTLPGGLGSSVELIP
jgi:toxin-antitoxin system PIN domain toxin